VHQPARIDAPRRLAILISEDNNIRTDTCMTLQMTLRLLSERTGYSQPHTFLLGHWSNTHRPSINVRPQYHMTPDPLDGLYTSIL
jgi:hypothetical protein